MSHQTAPPSTTPQAAPTAGTLSLTDVVAQSVGFMGPVFSVSVLLPMLVGITTATGNGAGAAAPLAVLIGTIGMLGIGWIVSAYARRIRAAGSLYNYVTEGLGTRLGAAAGYVYYLGVLVLGAGIAVLIGGTLYDDLKAEFGFDAVPVWAWQLIVLAIVVAVVHIGVQISVKMQLALALVSMAVLTVFFVYLIVKVGGDNSLTAFKPSSSAQGLSGIAFSVIYGVLLFTGFEAAANLAEETAEPQRSIPRAVLISLIASAVFFLLGCYAQIAGFHFDVSAVAENAGAPLTTLASPGMYGATWLARLVELVILLDMLAVYIGISVSVTRGVLTMARDGWLPKQLTRVNARRGTPIGGTAVVAVAYLLILLVSQAFPKGVSVPGLPDYFSWYAWLSAFGIFCLASIYLAMCFGAPRGLRGHASPAKVWGAAVIGVLITGGALFGSVYKVPSPTIWAALGAIGWCALAVVAAVAVKSRTAVTR
ncbi:APC family permease [Streptomyces sp. DG2A-72]|uniref:APC family permease n=1 Tax=Streptomyces sp. DG2A-72 TaxID=3051386 RepID=UPI00265C7A41|nr:APC family permease [Streptomyces sp. DG2A-72]MDO0938099.1 APC family permease [Streptomyces sp. DG2A-72]